MLGNTEQITEKLRELEGIGVDQFDIYLMTEKADETLAAYGSDVIPRFTGVAACVSLQLPRAALLLAMLRRRRLWLDEQELRRARRARRAALGQGDLNLVSRSTS